MHIELTRITGIKNKPTCLTYSHTGDTAIKAVESGQIEAEATSKQDISGAAIRGQRGISNPVRRDAGRPQTQDREREANQVITATLLTQAEETSITA